MGDNLNLLDAIYYRQLYGRARKKLEKVSSSGTTQLTEDYLTAEKYRQNEQEECSTKNLDSNSPNTKLSRSHSQPTSSRQKSKQSPDPLQRMMTLKQSPERSQGDNPKQPQCDNSKRSPGNSGSDRPVSSHMISPGQNRTVQITLQGCPRSGDQSGRKDLSTSRVLSNSSIYSELTSVDGTISPNPRATRSHHGDDKFPSTSTGIKDQTTTAISNKLASTLSPMIKRKVISAMQSVQANQNTLPHPKSNICLAFITLFICPPLGCLAWHQARQVDKLIAEDMVRARLASKMAATYSYIGFLIGGLILTAIFVGYVLVDAL
ncbi:hypothetical protein ACHWQZ_G006946 [Mnemiopsis leidyi]